MDLEVHERPGKSDKTGVDIDSVVDKSTKTKR
jgi:hypothetical protein